MLRRDIVKALGLMALTAGTGGLHAQSLVRGRRPRVILVSSGSYVRYRQVLLGVARGLEKLGLIERAPVLPHSSRTDLIDVWQNLATKAGGNALTFLANGLYDYNFDAQRRLSMRRLVLDRVAEQKDVDLILTVGTDATRDMSIAFEDIPVLSLSSSDPVASGLVLSAEDSGQDNLHVVIDQNRYAWQTEVFHAVYPYRHLALITSQTRMDRCGDVEIRACCRRLGVRFRLIVYYEDEVDEASDFEAFKRALEAVIEEGADAVMLPWFPCPRGRFREVVHLLTRHHVASFSLSGPEFVRQGILLGEGEQDLDGYGLFEAEVIRRVLDGEMPRSIPQALVQKSRITLNLATAMQLGWEPPLGLLFSVESAFTTQSGQ